MRTINPTPKNITFLRNLEETSRNLKNIQNRSWGFLRFFQVPQQPNILGGRVDSRHLYQRFANVKTSFWKVPKFEGIIVFQATNVKTPKKRILVYHGFDFRWFHSVTYNLKSPHSVMSQCFVVKRLQRIVDAYWFHFVAFFEQTSHVGSFKGSSNFPVKRLAAKQKEN